MADVVIIVLAIEKAMRAKHHGYHFLWSAGRLMECTDHAAQIGWLAWY